MIYDLYIATNDSAWVQVQEIAPAPTDLTHVVWVPKDYWFGTGPTPQRVYFTSKASLLDPTNVPTPAWAYWQYSTNCIGCTTPSTATNWAIGVGGSGYEDSRAIAVDTSNNVYIVGYFDSSLTIGGFTLNHTGTLDLVVAKFSPLGNCLWAKSFGGATCTEVPVAVGVSTNGVIVSGYYFGGTANFGGNDLTNSGGYDYFLASYSTATGAHNWSKRLGGNTYPNYIIAMAIDPNNSDIVLSGTFQTWAPGYPPAQGHYLDLSDGASGPLMSNGAVNGWMGRWNATGVWQWATNYPCSGTPYFNGLSVDTSSNITVVGYVAGGVNLGGGTLHSYFNGVSALNTMFIAKLNSAGVHQWSEIWNVGTETPTAISFDTNGNIYTAGYFTGTINLGGTNITGPYGGSASWVAKFLSDGSASWSECITPAQGMTLTGIASDLTGNVIVNGYTTVPLNLNNGVRIAFSGTYDPLLIKYSQTGVYSKYQKYGSGFTTPNGTSIDSSGFVVSDGFFMNAGVFFGTTLISSGSLDIFLFRQTF